MTGAGLRLHLPPAACRPPSEAMPLSFSPACLPVLRGGLPHASAQAAVSALLGATPDLVAWPSLPQRGFRETPLIQAAAGFPGLVLDIERERAVVDWVAAEGAVERLGLAYLRGDLSFGATPAEFVSGFGELLRQIEIGRRPCTLKGEILGPISLSLMLTDEHERPLAYDLTLREAILQHLSLRVAWQHQQLAAWSDHVVICLDEPFLDALGSPLCPLDWSDGIELIERLVDGVNACCGVCTSGALNWSALLSTPVDLVLFDAYEHSPSLIQASSAVAGFLERGGCIGWGIVPVDPAALAEEHVDTLLWRMESALDYLVTASGVDAERIRDASLITTNGSLALLTPAVAERALQICAAVARQLREKYQLQ